MAGQVTRSGRQRYQFATTATQGADITILREVEVVGSTEAQLVIKVHALTTVTNTTLTVVARATSPSSENPEIDFVITSSSLASQAIADALPAGKMYVVALSLGGGTVGNLGTHVRVSLVATAVAAGLVDVTLSTELVQKA